jgi:response regulator RpfG family c-di-GMP phosphodiesterase
MNLHRTSHFDLIIISIDSKQDDNFQLLQHLKTSSLLRKIPVLVLANGDDANLENECAELCVEAYVEKPFDPLIFLYKINSLLSGGQESKPNKRHVKIFSLSFYF